MSDDVDLNQEYEDRMRVFEWMEGSHERFFAGMKAWPTAFQELSEYIDQGRFQLVDEAIDILHKAEGMNAGVAESLKGKLEIASVLPYVSHEEVVRLRKLIDDTIRRCEMLRDHRWEVMTMRASKRVPTETKTVTSLSQLRRAVAARA